MSFIVKGVDLPKDGTAINLIVQSDGESQYIVLGNDKLIDVKKAKAVQIPKDHGRIGDLDGVIKRIDKSPTFASKYKDTARLFIDIYSDSNTILEEEEQE